MACPCRRPSGCDDHDPGHDGREPVVWPGPVRGRDRDLLTGKCPSGPADVVGLSLGGLVGLHLAVRRPDFVRSLLVSGVPLGDIAWPLRVANRLLSRLYARPWSAHLVARAFGMPDEASRHVFVDGATRTDTTARRRIGDELTAGVLPDLAGLSGPLLAVVGSKGGEPARRFVDEVPACYRPPRQQSWPTSDTSGTREAGAGQPPRSRLAHRAAPPRRRPREQRNLVTHFLASAAVFCRGPSVGHRPRRLPGRDLRCATAPVRQRWPSEPPASCAGASRASFVPSRKDGSSMVVAACSRGEVTGR